MAPFSKTFSEVRWRYFSSAAPLGTAGDSAGSPDPAEGSAGHLGPVRGSATFSGTFMIPPRAALSGAIQRRLS